MRWVITLSATKKEDAERLLAASIEDLAPDPTEPRQLLMELEDSFGDVSTDESRQAVKQDVDLRVRHINGFGKVRWGRGFEGVRVTAVRSFDSIGAETQVVSVPPSSPTCNRVNVLAPDRRHAAVAKWTMVRTFGLSRRRLARFSGQGNRSRHEYVPLRVGSHSRARPERAPTRTPVARKARPRGSARQTEPRYLTAAELDALLAKMSDTFRPVAFACTYAGLRISEALGLRWRDVDFKAETITVAGQLGANGERLTTTKTPSSAATLPLLPALRRELQAHRSRQASRNLALVHADALVFTTSRGKPQSRRNALRAVHQAGDDVGLNGEGVERVGVHDLRSSFVALSLAHANVTEATGLARHANPRVTLTMYGGSIEAGRETGAAKLVEDGFGA